MTDDTRDKVITLEADMKHVRATLESVEGKLDQLLLKKAHMEGAGMVAKALAQVPAALVGAGTALAATYSKIAGSH